MPRHQPVSVLTALGFSVSLDRLYQRLQGQDGRELISVADSLSTTPEAVTDELAPLVEHGIVRIEDERVHVLDPLEAVAVVLREHADATARVRQGLDLVSAALPFVAAAGAKPAPGQVHGVEPIDGEISSGGQPLALMTDLVMRGKGDLLWLRPDQWRLPREDQLAEVIRRVTATGRRSRAIYPVRALSEAPQVLQHRAEAGEEIRVVADLPTRMFIIGTTHLVLPEPFGMVDEPRSLIRQRGLVEVGTWLFELLWERAAPVPELDRGEARPDLRRFLLQQLAAGAKDEQIARALGISLRTVRRRVADVLIELGVDSRFQAGVEAVRRGWL